MNWSNKADREFIDSIFLLMEELEKISVNENNRSKKSTDSSFKERIKDSVCCPNYLEIWQSVFIC